MNKLISFAHFFDASVNVYECVCVCVCEYINAEFDQSLSKNLSTKI